MILLLFIKLTILLSWFGFISSATVLRTNLLRSNLQLGPLREMAHKALSLKSKPM